MIIGQLPIPLPYINDSITRVSWRVTYPENTMYYQLQNDTGQLLAHGNWQVPTSVTDVWGDDDTVVTDALIAASPWIPTPPSPPAPAPEPPPSEDPIDPPPPEDPIDPPVEETP
jgi:hypothetical protein